MGLRDLMSSASWKMFELEVLLGSWEELFILEKSENTDGEKEHKTTYNPTLENHC